MARRWRRNLAVTATAALAMAALQATPASAATRTALTPVPGATPGHLAFPSSSGRYVFTSFDADLDGPARIDRSTGAVLVLPQAPAASAQDGRLVFFNTDVAMVPEDTNGWTDVYRMDLVTNDLVWVSKDLPAQFSSTGVSSVSGSGDVVALGVQSIAAYDTLVRTVSTGATIDLADGVNEGQAFFESIGEASVSGDGTTVAFTVQIAPIGCPLLSFRCSEIWVRPVKGGVARRALSTGTTALPNASSWAPSLSSNGKTMAFLASSGNLGGAPGKRIRVWTADLPTGVNTVVSTNATYDSAPQLSRTGKVVAYTAPGPVYSHGTRYIQAVAYLWDTTDRSTIRLDLRSDGKLPRLGGRDLALSADGSTAFFWKIDDGPPPTMDYSWYAASIG